MKSKYISLAVVVGMVLGLVIGGCGSGGGTTSKGNQNVTVDPTPVIPAPDLTQSKLNSGKFITGTPKADCDNSFVLDAVNELCELFKLLKGDGSDACINQTSSCNSYERQLYTGSVLGPGPKGARWNGRGGSGALMADAAVCTLRELSPKVPGGGPVKSSTSLDIGIGKVVVKQEVGYLDFDRISGRFKGYRKLRIELPVIGKFDAVSQNIDMRRIFYGTGQLYKGIPDAGEYPLLFAYGLNLSTEEKAKTIDINPGSFDVETPIGIFQVSPHFDYKSNTVVADTPFVTDHTYIILPNDDFDNTPAAIRLSDIYGLIPGINTDSTSLPGTSNYKDLRTGWASQIGLGARGSIDDDLWSPPASGFFSRPDYDPTGVLLFEEYDSRSGEENLPSVYASASASVKYPKNPGDMLPDWVDGLPGLDWDAYIQVTPTIKAGAAGQFGISLSEGTDNQRDLKEFGAHAESRTAALGIYSGVEANASFEVLAELRLYVSAVFDFFVGSKRIDLIDINPKFPIPIAGGIPTSSKVELASAYSTSGNLPDLPEKLDYLNTFKGTKNPEEFINVCYAKVAEVPPEEPPCTKEEEKNLPECKTEKGDVVDLFKYLPCNICLATDAVVGTKTSDMPAHKEILSPVAPVPPTDSTTPGIWKCDAASKSGCMDICKLNKETGEFSVVKNPSEIADSMPTTDPDYNKLYPFYKSCMITCTEPPVGGILDISCGKGLDSTPPGILGIMVPGGGGTPAPVPVDTNIAAPFSEPMDPASVNTSTFTVSDTDGKGIAGTVTYDGSTYTATFTPSGNLEYNRTYTATVTTGVTDLAGNHLPADSSWVFTTEGIPDTEPPTVIMTSPVSGTTNVDVNSNIRAKFSEAMDGSTIHGGTFTIDNGVAGAVTYDSVSMTATFAPFAPLVNLTTYTVAINTGVSDVSGKALAGNYTWSFETAAARDVTPPGVNSTNPTPDATGVPLDTTVSVTFSEPVDISTVTDSTFTLSSGRTGNVLGTLSFSDGGATATFTPSAGLDSGDTYVATVTTGINDLAGNPMAGDFSWNFTTMSLPVAEERTAFVTSVQGNGNLSTWADAIAVGAAGLSAGDEICQARAAEAGLSGNFVAWLSDANNDAYCRVHNLTGKKSANCGQASLPVDAGPWLRMDGFPFSGTIDQLVNDGEVYAPVLYNELNNTLLPPAEYYLTGTTADGTWDSTLSSCYNWTSPSGGVSGTGGQTDGATNSWTYAYSAPCSSTSWRLLCLETGTGFTPPPFATEGKKVFVTSESGNGDLGSWPDAVGNRGTDAGDAICRTRAEVAGFPNSANFKAWLSTPTVNAIDRLTSDGPWVRPDGVIVANNKTDLTDGGLFTAISQTETGAYMSAHAWTATEPNGIRYSSAPPAACEGWTTTTPSAIDSVRIGDSGHAYWSWSATGYSTCSVSRHLYCFED